MIEYFLYKIPGLSEKFLFANDDMFFNADLEPDFFFTEEGLPIVRLKNRLLGSWNHPLKIRINALLGKEIGQYAQTVEDSAVFVKEKFGKYYKGVPHHNIDAYLKSDYQECMEVICAEQVKKSQVNHFRSFGDLQRSVISYIALARGRAHLKYVHRNESSRILVYKHQFSEFLQKYQPKLFCLNDNQHVTDEHRKNIKPFLESVFPEKSSFEK